MRTENRFGLAETTARPPKPWRTGSGQRQDEVRPPHSQTKENARGGPAYWGTGSAGDDELQRLLERYPGALLLVYLKDKTKEELKGLAGASQTFRRRLEEGRERLRSRLRRWV